jgi:hypothetical protein
MNKRHAVPTNAERLPLSGGFDGTVLATRGSGSLMPVTASDGRLPLYVRLTGCHPNYGP